MANGWSAFSFYLNTYLETKIETSLFKVILYLLIQVTFQNDALLIDLSYISRFHFMIWNYIKMCLRHLPFFLWERQSSSCPWTAPSSRGSASRSSWRSWRRCRCRAGTDSGQGNPSSGAGRAWSDITILSFNYKMLVF